VVLSLILSALSWAALTAAVGHPETKNEKTNPVAPSPAITPGESSNTSPADDMLKALLRNRPSNEVIPPTKAPHRSSVKPPKGLQPEGTTLIGRRGSLQQEGDEWWFHPADAENEPPLRLLPNGTLEEMVRISDGAPAKLTFLVSGERTVFRNENYLLPTVGMRALDPAPALAEPAAADRPASDAPVEDVLNVLRSQQPPHRLLPPDPAQEGRTTARRGTRVLAPMLEGTPIVNRPGRLVPTGNGWTLIFEANHPDAAEPPMRLLPNLNLEMMIGLLEKGTPGLIFVVSGDVTAFEGGNYLLVRMALRRPDVGNLSK